MSPFDAVQSMMECAKSTLTQALWFMVEAYKRRATSYVSHPRQPALVVRKKKKRNSSFSVVLVQDTS